MDANRFDALSRSLAVTRSRRGALPVLTGGALGGFLVALGRAGVAASHGCRHDGERCRKHGQCCSGKCSRKRKKCVCTEASCTTTDPCQVAVCSSKFKCSFTADSTKDGQLCSGDTGTCHSGECVPIVCGNGLCQAEAGEDCDSCATDCCPTVTGVSVSPDPVLIGSPSQGTVTLNRAAQGDTTVSLSVSDTSAASVDGSVTVPDGQTSASFPVTGLEPSDQVTLVATLGVDEVQTTFAVENASE